MKLFVYLLMALPLCLSSCLNPDDYLKSYYETYEAFNSQWESIAKYLPESSSEIYHYKFLGFDTNHHFIEANVEFESLKEFVVAKNYFDSKHHGTNVSYSDELFDKLFHKRPEWWNYESILEFEENQLIIFADKNNYGKGCWFFYDHEKQKIRLFTWSQQWLSSQDVIKAI
jgi:hypothetical protein